MNKIYKVIWNRVRHCYVVVSEIAKNHGKEHSTNLRVSKGLCALTLAIGLSLSSYAFAADTTTGQSDTKTNTVVDLGNGGTAAYDGHGNLTIGDKNTVAQGSNKKEQNNTVIGTQTDTLRKDTNDNNKGQAMAEDNKKLVDGEGQAHPITTSTEAGGSTAIGYQSHAEGTDSTAIGNNAKINDKLVTYYADKDGNQTTSMDDAAWYKDDNGNPTRKPQVFRDADNNTTTTPQYKYTHTVTAEDGTTSTVEDITTDVSKAEKDDKGNLVYNYNPYDNTSYLYSVQLYQSAANSIAAGTNVTANGSSAVAVGDSATADGNSTIAIGKGAKATDTSAGGTGSIAIGKGVEANGSSTAVGLNGTEATYGSSAYGNNAVAQNGSSALGSNIQASGGSYASGMGTADKPVSATGSSYATGMGGTTATNGSMAVGNNVKAGDQGGGAFAIGMGGTMADNGSMAMGNNVSAGKNGGGAFAVGMGGTSADGSSMAVGDNVHATSSAFASGRNGTSAENGGIAYGDNVSAKCGGFAAGTNSTSASSGVAIGSNVHASDGSSYAGGMNNTTANNGSIAFGNNVHAGSSNGGAFAAGMNGTTADGSSVAVGDNVHATGGSFAAGMGGTSASSSAVAIGNNAHAYGNSYAFGSSANADSTSAAIGNSSYATNSSLALGNSAGAYVSGGIALGSNSTVYRGSGTTGLDPRTGKAYTDTSDKTWNSTYGALSIGNVDSDGTVNGTRQIIGVAAGTNDTDAVNVAQLKAAMTQSGSIHDYSVNSTDTAADTNYSNAGATGKNALAAGVSAQAKGTGAVAVGNGAQASKNYSVAIGNGAQATQTGAIALGNGAVATGIGAMVIGQYNTAEGQNSLAFGGGYNDKNKGNKASSTASVAFGEGSWAVSEGSVAFGYSTQAGNIEIDPKTQEQKISGQNAVAFGNGTKALGGRSLAFGENTTANYNDSVAFGNGATAYSSGAVAFGNRSRALSQYATSFGDNSVAAGSMSFAFGTDTIAGAALDDNGALELTDGSRMDSYGNKAYTTTDAGGNKTTYSIKGMKPFSGNDPHDYVVVTGTKADGTTGTYVEDYQGGIVEVKVNADGTVTKVKDLYSGKYGGWYQYNEQGNIIQTGTGKNKKPAVVSSDTLKAQNKPIPVTLDKATPGSNGYTLNGFKNATSFGYSTEASGDNATAFGNDTKAKASAATAFGTTTTASGVNATAFGLSTTASGKQATAFGSSSTASGDNATAFGESSVANGEASVAFGIKSEADGKNSLAGLGGKAYADNTIALGQNASAHVDGAIAIGNTAYDQATNGVALGTRASIVPHGSETISDATAIGTDTKVMGSRSTAIGYKASAMKDDAVVLGNNIISQAEHSTIIGFDGGISSGTYNTVVGADSGVSGNYNTSIGYKNNIIQSSNSLVLGSNSKINGGSQLVAIGYNATTQNGSDSLALGFNNAAQGSNNISIGTNSMTMNDITTAIGYHASAYGGNGATAIGQYTTANGENSAVLGSGKSADQQTSAIGKNSLALGAAAKVVADSSLAIGDEAATTGKQSIAIGYKAQAHVNKTIGQDDKANALAIGSEAGVSSANGMALGSSAQVSGENGTALGNKAAATGKDGAAIGTSSNVWGEAGVALGRNTGAAEDSTAIGDGANAWKSHAMALGKGANGAVEYGIALGEGATVTNPYKQDENNNWVEDTEHAATGAVAIGRSALTNVEGGVALGQNSQSVTAKGVAGYDVLTKAASTDSSSTWVSTSGAVSVGDKAKNLTRQITNLAAGYEDTDAVNVAQLKAVANSHTTVSVGNQKATADNTLVKGGNLELTRTTTNGQANFDVSLNKDVTLGEQEENKGGSLVVNSVAQFRKSPESSETVPMKEAVKIDGTTVSVVKNDGTNDQRQVVLGVGQDTGGYVALFDNTGKTPTYIFNAISNGITYLKDEANEFNRLEYGDIYNGSTQFIATLDDGLKFAGDQGTMSAVKLNQKLSVTGGVTDKDSLSTAANIGVVSSQDGEDGKLELRLNKDLSGLNSVTAGNVRIGNNTANTLKLTENGQVTENTAPAGNYATGLDNKAWDTKNPSYVSGRAATEDQLAIVSGVVDKGLSFTTNTKDATNTTDNYTGYKVVNRQLGDTISIKAGDADPNMTYETKNLTSKIAENGDITISMADKPTFSEVTASSFNLSPKDTTTKDQAGNTASAQLNAHYRDASLNPKKNVTMADGSTGMVRLHYHDGEGTIHDLATMDDGQIYAGDITEDGTLDTTGFGRKMNEKTTINGGVKEKDNLTDNNIGVVSNSTDTLTVKLAKNLQNLESVQAGKTTIDDNGLTIKKSDDDSSKNVVVLGGKVAFGDNQVNNMGSGASKITEDDKGNKTYEYNTLNNGANIGDVKNIANNIVQPVIDTVNKGWELDVNGTKQKAVTPDSPKVNFIQGQNITITGDTANTDNVTIATADDVRFNTVRVGGVKSGDTYSGGILIGTQSGKNADGTESANSNDDYYITGLKNTNWDSDKIMKGRAATEDQLKQVATEIKQGSVAGDIYVTGGSVSYNGEGTDTHAKDGKGSINLTRKNGEDVNIDGLHDYYVTGGTVTDDGKKLELTRNDIDGSGNPKKITVDLGNVLKNDLHLVANPAADSNGKYKVDTTTGTVTLKVQNADGTTSNDITIGGFEGLGQGLKFGANKMAKDGGGNPVTNQLGSTINITGAGTKGLTDYSGKNLLTSVEQDAAGNTTVHVLMDKNISADGVTVGQAGKDGVAGADGEVGKAGTIGINGKNGVEGEDGKQGITTTIIRTEKGQAGKDGEIGQQGAPGVDGKDITRIVYQNDQDKVDGKDGSHTVATLDDGLKFSGDDKKVITKKLNEQLQFVGGANKLTQNNIGVVEKDGKLWIQLAETPDLGTNGNLKAGDAQIGWVAGDTLVMTKDGTNPSGNKAGAGSYATGLSNKDWDITDPEYVSGRAATEDQLAKVSKAINNAATAAGKRTVVTVNDKANPAEATPKDGDYGDYDSTNGNLMIAAKKDTDGVLTYNIKLNDNLAIGQKGENGKDGKVTVDTKGGTTVVIGHDGEPGKDGKDGISVKGKDGKDGVTISVTNGKNGKDGSEGHIGLTGPKGEKGADGTPGRDGTSIDISTDYGTKTLDSNKNVTVDNKEQASRIIYNDAKGPHEVATMDDGLKIGANAAAKEKAANPVSNKLNSTINIIGSVAKENHTYTEDNLTTTVEQDEKGNTTVKVLMDKDITGNSVTVGRDGQEGSIGIAGKNGIDGEDGKQGITTTIIKTEKGQNGKDGEIGKQGAPGVDGKDITRIVYQNDKNNNDKNEDGKHVVATLDDGLKFIGDDSTAKPVTKKLNDTLQIRGDGTYDKDKNTVADDGNIKTSVDNGAVKVSLSDKINLHQGGSLTVGGGSTTGDQPIIIKHFDAGKLTVTGTGKDGKTPQSVAGDYVTGLDNKDWDVDYPTYVSGRAATEDQLKKISDTIKTNAETAAGQHTEITVNDKKAPTIVASDKVGTTDYGDYVGGNDNLLIAAKKDPTSNKMTYNIKLNDQLTIGQKGEQGEPSKPSTPGKDGKVTVETKGGTTVIIGHDGKDGEDGKDGLFVTGKDGKDGKFGVSIIGPNGAAGADGVDGQVGITGKDGKDAVSIAGKNGVGHIGLTGPKGEQGADGTPGRAGISIDITTDLKAPTLDDGKNVKTVIKDKDGKETTITQAPRIQYESNGKNYEVATMDDGLKFVGNDGKEVTKKLNSTLSLTGGMDKDAVAKASSKNLGVRQNASKDGLEIVMTDTPDFTKVTVGEGTDTTQKIIIGKQTVTGKKSDGNPSDKSQTGNYITGLDNKAWDKDNVVENRAATEGQLRDIAGSITNQNQGGGFALTSDEKGANKIVKQDLGKAIQIKGDTTYKADGSVEKPGNIKTSVDNGAIKVELNKDVDLTKDGSIKAGETTINKGGVDTNKVTIKDSTISISKDGINGGGKQITDVASGASEIIKDADGKVSYKYDNETNAANIGDVKRIAGDMKTEINNNISNVTNKVDQIGQHVDNIQNDVKQLKTDVKADRTYQGDDGAAKKVKVKFGSFLSLTGGAKLADLTEEGNIGVVQKEIDDPDNKGEKIAGLSVRLAKHLNLEKTTYTSNENGQTYTSEIDGKGLTIKTGDENRNITVQDGNVNMGGNQIHNVAPGQAPGDAVNVGQLNATNQTVANLGGAVNKLGTRVNRVGAGAAALAALHPLDFDPDDKWDFAAGYGNYKDASAVAVGAYYRPNEDTMFSVGGSFGGGENMINAGVSFKVGQGNHVSTSRVAMAKEIKDLRQDVANLNAIVNRQSALIDKLTGTNAGTIQDTGNDLFPDVPANHWAYEYVTKLKQAGILTGYPDGNFDGDRMMTRYEFAAIVYRAIMAGAASNPALSQDGTLDKLAKEFSPEMKHIRIDTIAKDKNGKPTIERVRVIPEAQQ